MTTIRKLQQLKLYGRIYNICFRRAGVGIQYYDPPKDFKIKVGDNTWHQYLKVNKYHSTFGEAIDAEYKRFFDINENERINHD